MVMVVVVVMTVVAMRLGGAGPEGGEADGDAAKGE